MPSIAPKEGISLSEIALKINTPLKGDAETKVFNVCSLETPDKGCLTFAKQGAGKKDIQRLKEAGVAAVVISQSDEKAFSGLNLLIADNPLAAFFAAVPLFFAPVKSPSGIHATAQISESATVSPKAAVGACCVIGDHCIVEDGAVLHPHVVLYPGVKIGAGSVLHSGVVIREECIIGKNCIIHNGSVIGADGFGYYPDPKAGLVKIPQIGNVVISDRVEIGANSCIDRAAMGSTFIGMNSKIDNLVQIGHGTKVGHNSIICGSCAIGGSCNIGNQVVLGGSTGVADHITIVDGCRTGGRSGVANDLTEKGDYLGFPAVKAQEWRRTAVALRKLPALVKKGGTKDVA